MRRSKILLIGISGLLFFLTLEVLCWIFPYSGRGSHESAYQSKLEDIQYHQLTRTGHPYFGNVYRSDEKVNNAGFVSEYDYPYKKKTGDFVVGIFGGSVAHDFAAEVPQEFALMLKKNNPKLSDKKIIILNMALHGTKQPQQFLISSFYNHSIDLSINIDGFNEFHEVSPEFPAEYPSTTGFYLVSAEDKARKVYFSSLIYRLQKFMAKTPLSLGFLSYSQSYFFVWSVVDNFLSDLVVNKILKAEGKVYKHTYEDKIGLWYSYTSDQSRFLEGSGIPAYFFIQPNQYVVNSKKLSEQELKTAFSGPNVNIDIWYKWIRSAADMLKKNKVRIFDLSNAFQDVRETVYIDDCCHINKTGNLILAERISKIVKAP